MDCLVKKYEILGIIPARGGSKGLPFKNIKLLYGHPLISYSITSGLNSKLITRLVSTDDEQIAIISEEYGAEVPFRRPDKYAEDDTLDFPVINHALNWLNENENYNPDIVVQMRPTSPLRPKGLIDKSINLLIKNQDSDSVRGVTAPSQNPFKMWKKVGEYITPLIKSRLVEPYNMPRQDLPDSFWQTGHIDVIKIDTIRKKKSLSGDNILPILIENEFCIDIDNEDDFENAESILLTKSDKIDNPKFMLKSLIEHIELLVFDFDGVFTDNKVLVDEDGKETVLCDGSDGMVISMLKKTGLELLILSSERNKVVNARADKLRINVFNSIEDKLKFLTKILAEKKIAFKNVAYIGNDLNDFDCMTSVGLSISPANAHEKIKKISHLILKKSGGNGAIRELCDIIIKFRK